LKFIRWTARFLGSVFYYFIPIRKRTAVKNLKLAFPGKSSEEISKIIKGAYKNIFIVILEFFYMPKLNLNELKEIVRIENPGFVKELLSTGNGLIIISAHFANWELMAWGASRVFGEPFNVIVKEQANKLIDRRINRIRESKGNRMIDMNMGIRDTLWLLRNNKVIAMLTDQSAPENRSVKIDFFIKDVPVFEGAARFALKTGARVMFGIPVRNKDYSYTVNVKEIDTSRYSEYNEDNVRKLTQEHVNMLVEYITNYPDHWLWFHRRFKHVIKY
jgi:KDO2-lipid IV(A) lauroyltransferase